MPIKVAIFGAGGLGQIVHDILVASGRCRPVCFLDSDPAQHGRRINGLTVIGGPERLPELRRAGVRGVTVAIGDNPTRVHLARELRDRGFELVSAVHPLASAARSAQIGGHVIIGARAVICVHARVADHAVISTGAIVDHDNVIGCGAFLHPAARLAGGVTVEELAVIGIGACVIPGRTVGRAARVEPGSVVIRDVLAGERVAGVPARTVRYPTSRFVAEPPQAPAGTAPASGQPAVQSLAGVEAAAVAGLAPPGQRSAGVASDAASPAHPVSGPVDAPRVPRP